MEIKFRTLKANEIECRVGQISEKGFSLLIYKDARCDMNLLDSTVGAMNWSRQHTNGNANCIVSIYDTDKKEWVSKEDTGTENYTEKEKSLASDSFKRVCVNWGIGRELYSAPFIYVNGNVKKNSKGAYVPDFYNIKVSEIGYNENREINYLVITGDGEPIFTFPKKQAQKDKSIKKEFKCQICGNVIDEKLYNQTIKSYGAPLCCKECKEEWLIKVNNA